METWLIAFCSIVLAAFILSIALSIIKRLKKSNHAQTNCPNSQTIQMSPPSYLQVVPNQRPIGFQPSPHALVSIQVHPTVSPTSSQNLINSESSRVPLNTNQPHMMQVNGADNLAEDNPPPPYDETIADASTHVVIK